MAAALAEFSAKGLAGARTNVIARRAGVHEGMIFYCFKTKKNLYREVLRRRLAESRIMIEANADDNFASRLADGYESVCSDANYVRMTQWEALGGGKRKLVAEEERHSLVRANVTQLRREKVRGKLPADADEEMLVLVSAALRVFPLAFPQVTRQVSGLGPIDRDFGASGANAYDG